MQDKRSPIDLLDPPGRKRIRTEIDRERGMIPDQIAKSIAACVLGVSPWPLLLSGGVGVGKTRAALYLCDRIPGRSWFRDYAEMCDEVRRAKAGELVWRGSHDQAVIEPAEYWDAWWRCELGVIDEIGSREKCSDHQYETLKIALDTREGKPLVLISNLRPAQLATLFDDRIASRCAAGTVVMVAGKDQRTAVLA